MVPVIERSFDACAANTQVRGFGGPELRGYPDTQHGPTRGSLEGRLTPETPGAVKEVTPLPNNTAYTIDALKGELKHAVRYGAKAHSLHRHAPRLVEMLNPPARDEETQIPDRAIATEELIRRAIRCIEEYAKDSAEALSILLGLQHDRQAQKSLHERRREAGQQLGYSIVTFRKKYEDEILEMLAFAIWRIQNLGCDATRPN